ncbi:MAG TPA: alpha/beta hydrolase, partial [Acidimicrobiales bacterium]
MVDTALMTLPDGRDLAWLEVGDQAGPAVFAFHGTPGSRNQIGFLDAAIADSGARLIIPDRPGYGHSTFHKGRRLSDWATDVACLADHLGLERFSVIGLSGGGPHASVCARYLPDRVAALGIVSGVGPLHDAEAAEGMMPANQIIAKLARRSQYLIYPLFGLETFLARRWPDVALRTMLKMVPEADAAVIGQPDYSSVFIDDAKRASPTSAMAASQDFALFAREWGFRLEDIHVLTHVWHGDVDRNVPFEHGRRQAKSIEGAQFHACPGEGHFLVIGHFGEILHAVTNY